MTQDADTYTSIGCARVPPRSAAVPLCLALALGVALLHPAHAGGLVRETARESDQLIALTNLDRTSNGLPALAVDHRLVELASERSVDMVARDYFSHWIPPHGRTVFDLMHERDIAYRTAGENLSYNTAAHHETALFAQRAFMDSPTHRALILSPEFDYVGAAATAANDRRIFHTVLFLGLGRDDAESGGAEPLHLPTSPSPPPSVAPSLRPPFSPAPQAGRLRPAGTRPLGLVEQLVQRTLRLYLGL